MHKIILILRREYLSRVRKKSFIIMTLLGPLLFAAMLVIPAWLSSIEDSEEKNVAIIDHSGLYLNKIKDTPLLKFHYLTDDDDESFLRQNLNETIFFAFVVIEDDLLINPSAIKLYSDMQITMDVGMHITASLREILKEEKLKTFQISGLENILYEINNVNITLTTLKLGTDGSEKQSSTEIAMIISIIFAFLTYMFVFVYGTQVMRGVMEEKTSRIVEVIISSVKPFQLMMGKIIGIALVALTQFFLWIALTLIIATAATKIVFNDVPTAQDFTSVETIIDGSEQMPISGTFNIGQVLEMAQSINPIKTLLLFLFYFIGGYLLYAALFAAVGSAIDNETDSQQFMLPITLPIIIGLYVAMAAFRNPHSDLVFWFSIIPFTSPVVMMSRIPFDVPPIEIAISMALLVAGFIFTTWFASRIYRTGILMYGKKVNYKEIWKWFKYSNK